ncbi:MAG: PH domain-containing protein [Bacteroidales bacterium]|nr:PH domain-containing protein [Bacteroidales bacterium]
MIDFSKNPIFKLSPTNLDGSVARDIVPILLAGEKFQYVYSGGRDGVAFTDKRIIALNVQGLTGSKKDFTSLPYNKIQAFSVETAGTFDRDAELEIWFSGLGKVKFEFSRGVDVSELARVIYYYMNK